MAQYMLSELLQLFAHKLSWFCSSSEGQSCLHYVTAVSNDI